MTLAGRSCPVSSRVDSKLLAGLAGLGIHTNKVPWSAKPHFVSRLLPLFRPFVFPVLHLRPNLVRALRECLPEWINCC
jgi:hypothetical protein